MTRELVPFLVRLPPDLHRAVKAAAAEHDRSMAQEIRYAIREHLKTNEDA